MADDDDTPAWVKPLFAGPIQIDDDTKQSTLTETLEERLSALLELYQCEPTPTGWRNLALRLALNHEFAGQSVMKIETPVDRPDGIGGAEPGEDWWIAQMVRERAKTVGSIKMAAVQIAKETGRSARTLENNAGKGGKSRLKPPRFLQRLKWDKKIAEALRAAADRLEQSRK